MEPSGRGMKHNPCRPECLANRRIQPFPESPACDLQDPGDPRIALCNDPDPAPKQRTGEGGKWDQGAVSAPLKANGDGAWPQQTGRVWDL
jgi:hypothetical protein